MREFLESYKVSFNGQEYVREDLGSMVCVEYTEEGGNFRIIVINNINDMEKNIYELIYEIQVKIGLKWQTMRTESGKATNQIYVNSLGKKATFEEAHEEEPYEELDENGNSFDPPIMATRLVLRDGYMNKADYYILNISPILHPVFEGQIKAKYNIVDQV